MTGRAAVMALSLLYWAGPALAATYTGDQYRDPFSALEIRKPAPALPEEKPAAPSEFRLDGVIWVPDKPRALINGRRVTAGMEVDGAKVVEIRRKEVTILLNSQQMILKIHAEEETA